MKYHLSTQIFGWKKYKLPFVIPYPSKETYKGELGACKFFYSGCFDDYPPKKKILQIQ